MLGIDETKICWGLLSLSTGNVYFKNTYTVYAISALFIIGFIKLVTFVLGEFSSVL